MSPADLPYAEPDAFASAGETVGRRPLFPDPTFYGLPPLPAPVAPDTDDWQTPPGFVPVTPPKRRPNTLSIVLVVLLVLAVLGGGAAVAMKVLGRHQDTAGRPVAVAAGAGMTIRSTSGHFVIRLPAGSQRRTERLVRNGHHVLITLVGSESAKQFAGAMIVTPAVPASRMKALLTGGVAGFVDNGSLSGQHSVTFRRHPGVHVSATMGGEVVQLTIVTFSTSRVYIFVAATNASLKSLERSFRALP